ncbi:MAG: hypothetical protein ACFCVD_10890 [Nodosilinea sp.]
MLSTLIVIGFIFTIAGLHQIFLNRLLTLDLDYLKTLTVEPHQAPGKLQVGHSTSP